MFKEAGEAYREAFLASPTLALKPKPFRRFLMTKFRSSKRGEGSAGGPA
jgi:hypothetical protein